MSQYGCYPNPQICEKSGIHWSCDVCPFGDKCKVKKKYMSGCPGCNITEKEYQQLLEQVEQKGKAYAVEHQKLVVVYLDDERRPRFMEHGAAKSAGIIPIKHISHLQ